MTDDLTGLNLENFPSNEERKKKLEEFCGGLCGKNTHSGTPLLALRETKRVAVESSAVKSSSVKNGAALELRIRNASVLPGERLKDAGGAARR